MQQAASNFESTVQSEVSKTETDLNQSVQELNQAVEAPPVDWREAAEKKPDPPKPA